MGYKHTIVSKDHPKHSDNNRKSNKKRPTLSYYVYLSVIFTILFVTVIGINGTQLNNYCPDKNIDCQVFLEQGETNPWRNNIVAKRRGWYYGGYAGMDSCWVGWPKLCQICEDSLSKRAKVCQKKFPRHITRPGLGVKMMEGVDKINP